MLNPTDRFTKQVAHEIRSTRPVVAKWRQGTVTDTDPLTVTLGGSSVPIPGVKRLSGTNWTPAAGHVVHVLRIGTDLLVLGPDE